MADNGFRAPPGPITFWLRAVRRLVGRETRTGRLATRLERALSGLVRRAGTKWSVPWPPGSSAEEELDLQSLSRRVRDLFLRMARLPTSGEMAAVQDHLRRLGDQIEALNAQLDRLEGGAKGDDGEVNGTKGGRATRDGTNQDQRPEASPSTTDQCASAR